MMQSLSDGTVTLNSSLHYPQRFKEFIIAAMNSSCSYQFIGAEFSSERKRIYVTIHYTDWCHTNRCNGAISIGIVQQVGVQVLPQALLVTGR
jgi:hypothetical protein